MILQLPSCFIQISYLTTCYWLLLITSSDNFSHKRNGSTNSEITNNLHQFMKVNPKRACINNDPALAFPQFRLILHSAPGEQVCSTTSYWPPNPRPPLPLSQSSWWNHKLNFSALRIGSSSTTFGRVLESIWNMCQFVIGAALAGTFLGCKYEKEGHSSLPCYYLALEIFIKLAKVLCWCGGIGVRRE